MIAIAIIAGIMLYVVVMAFINRGFLQGLLTYFLLSVLFTAGLVIWIRVRR